MTKEELAKAAYKKDFPDPGKWPLASEFTQGGKFIESYNPDYRIYSKGYSAGYDRGQKDGEAQANKCFSVKERWPELLTLVLAFVRDGEDSRFGHWETLMLYKADRNKVKWSHIKSEECVTHWMPLPKPPI